jgi:hypothetical protein
MFYKIRNNLLQTKTIAIYCRTTIIEHEKEILNKTNIPTTKSSRLTEQLQILRQDYIICEDYH